ncbi:MAG TPA: hypothetical protein VFA67_17845 [Candidatus Sulfotelmatobacter sp.]|nr:hypothetical protein [Candidatus Sulfotelmatobacter sp.]
MTDSLDSWFTQPYLCRDCGSDVGFRSRRRTFTERYVLPLLLLQPVRCGECFRRDYRLIFTPVRERSTEIARITPIKAVATSKQNVA